MPRTRHARRVTAVWLCLAWLVGFELGPDLHQAMHPRLAAHHHDGDHRPQTTPVPVPAGDPAVSSAC